ncbi:MAG: rhodanese-like domain-containing protein [Nitritalea sp.]
MHRLPISPQLSLFLLGLTFFFAACSQAQNEKIIRLDAEEFASYLAAEKPEDIILLDVRTEREIREGYIAGAAFADVLEDSFEEKVAKLDRTKKFYVYCRSANRSQPATELLAKLGIAEIYELKGGMIAWEKAGKPVEKP